MVLIAAITINAEPNETFHAPLFLPSRISLGLSGCWAHARRYFFQAVEAHPDDRAAIALVATIDELFAIDAQARDRNLSLTERDLLRQQNAGPILEWIKS